MGQRERLVVLILFAALAAVPAPAAGEGGGPDGSKVANLDAVLVQMLGPVGVDTENPARLRIMLPTTETMFVRAQVWDADGQGIPNVTLSGELLPPAGAPIPLEFRPGSVDGMYASQKLTYSGGVVTFRVETEEPVPPVEKSYFPIGANLPLPTPPTLPTLPPVPPVPPPPAP